MRLFPGLGLNKSPELPKDIELQDLPLRRLKGSGRIGLREFTVVFVLLTLAPGEYTATITFLKERKLDERILLTTFRAKKGEEVSIHFQSFGLADLEPDDEAVLLIKCTSSGVEEFIQLY